MKIYPRLLAVCSLFFLTVGLCAQADLDQLDAELSRLAEEGHFSGNLLLADGGTVIHRKSYGYADFTARTPLSPDAVLELASVSKQFTAAAVSLLVADGRVVLDTTVAHYLPELAAYPTLTVRHLVHHTGGLPDYMQLVDELDTVPQFVTNDFMLTVFRDSTPEPEFAPGAKYSYSNTGYLVLASLIERVSGQSFGDFLRQRLFEPLGMNDSQVYRRRFERRTVKNFVPGHVWEDGRYVNPDSLEDYEFVTQLDGVVGDGMVNSTLDDLLRWDRALAAGKLLDTTLLFTPGTTNDGDTTDYAFGLMIRRHDDYGRMISHSGGWPGMATFIYRFPETDRTAILLRNDDGGYNQRLNVLRNVLRTLNGLPLELDRLRVMACVPPTTEQRADLPGIYTVDEDFGFMIGHTDDCLLLDATDQPTMNLVPADTTDRYDVIEMNAQVDFFRDQTGKVDSMTLRFPSGYTLEAKREEEE